MSNNTISRKIHFFHFGIKELMKGGSEFKKHSSPGKVFGNIVNLKLKGNNLNSRFKHHENSDVTFLAEVKVEKNTIKGKFAISRRSSLPDLETNGVLKPLNIPKNSGLAEITHFIYYPQKEVIGVEFNFFGPRTNSLVNYLMDKSRNFTNPFEEITLKPILNHDLDSLLQDVGEINLFQMEIARNDISIVKDLNESLYSAFKSAGKISNAESVEVVLRKKRYARDGFQFPFKMKDIKALLSKKDNRQKINTMKANAESNNDKSNKDFDFLEDKMITSKKVARLSGRSRSVDSISMFNRIEEAYRELNDNF